MTMKLATVNLTVTDPERSKRFYIDALGMVENAGRSQPPGFAYLESAAAHLTLATPQNAAAPEPSRTTELGFEVEDLAELQARFARLGVTGFRSQSMGWGEVIEGHDPDGYRIIVYRLAPSR